MKKIKIILAVIAPLFFTSCIVVDNTPGPNGRDGRAYFGIDYEHHAPYSYWDDNNSVPYNPILGEYYLTRPGVFEFEYFINAHDYYYGTYEVWINRGGIGGYHGEAGYDGMDTYLMLITDPEGFHEHADGYKMGLDEPIVIEKKIGEFNYKITIQKGNVNDRLAQQPKYKNS
ncbi:MAG: hypothetical protein HRT73_15760 [Flavobacteriales bacterium]|nr:hypothetical protein [Flavobacteriales bacterium]